MAFFNRAGGHSLMRSRWKSIIFFGALAATAVLLVAPIASALSATVTASLDCNGTVSYTLSSWAPGQRDGTNPDIYVTDSQGNTEPVPAGAFTLQVSSFSGSYTIPTSVNSLTLTPHAGAPWGADPDGTIVQGGTY